MSGSAARASIYEKMEISKDGKNANLIGKTVSFDYYESLYSPEVTATLLFVDAGASIESSKAQDSQGRLGSIKSALPITGFEDVQVKIKSKSGTLNFPFKVNAAPTLTEDANRQSVFLSLKSSSTYENLDIKDPCKKYTGRISDTVKKILKDLNVRKSTIDPTQNNYDFYSNGVGGLDLINDLCRRSIPQNGDPAYFFYETQRGINFRGIDNLISQSPVETYTYVGGSKANLDNDNNDYRILLPPNVLKDQDVEEALKWMSSRNVFFNPSTLKVEEPKIYSLKDSKVKKLLGRKPALEDKIKSYSTSNFIVLDVGSTDADPNELTPNNDPREWQAKSPMRYNLLHSQIMEIQVPCNLQLNAGDVIKCEFQRQGEVEMGGADQQISGNFLILHLCHHFDTERSYTSMTICRDAYGLYTNKS
jgi:hypothetical protein